MHMLKSTIKQIPLIGRLLSQIYSTYKIICFPGSKNYWERRYINGGTSGEGSYKEFAKFKADIINDFVTENNIHSVIEFGCGDGNQLFLAEYPSYIGLDISRTAVTLCQHKFLNDYSKSFFLYDCDCFIDNHGIFTAELSLSLDVIYHLIENEIFEKYMAHLFTASKRFVIIYSSNFEQRITGHVRHRKFTDWIDKNTTNWHLKTIIPNRYKNSPSNFYIYENLPAEI